MISRCSPYIGSLVTVVLLAGCSAIEVRQDGTATAETRKAGFMGLVTKDDIEVFYAPAFKDVRKVIIGGFKVGFNESKKFSEQTSGVLSPGTSTTALVQLAGISPVMQQQITDKVYENFVGFLKANGYEVVPHEQFTQTPDYKKLTTSDFPFKVDQSGIFSSYGVGYYYSPSQIGNKQLFFPGEHDGTLFGGFTGAGVLSAGDKFSQDTDIRVLGVSLMLDFAGASSGQMFSSAKLELGQLMSVDAGQVVISRADKGVRTAHIGTLKLGQPVYSDKTFATITNISTDTDVAVQATTNAVFGFLRGGLLGAVSQQANQVREFRYDANPDEYTTAAIDALDKTSGLFVEKMVSLRQAAN